MPGETWTLFDEEFATNPRDLVLPEIWAVFELWRRCQGGFGMTLLPDAGGLTQQAAWIMEAFDVMAATEAELRKTEPRG